MNIVVYDASKFKYVDSGIDVSNVGGVSAASHPYIVLADGERTISLPFTIESGDDMDVWYNGRQMWEGASSDFTFNYNDNEVIFNYDLYTDDKVKVRRY